MKFSHSCQQLLICSLCCTRWFCTDGTLTSDRGHTSTTSAGTADTSVHSTLADLFSGALLSHREPNVLCGQIYHDRIRAMLPRPVGSSSQRA